MRKPASMQALEDLGRVRLSKNFFFRDFLHSEIGSFFGRPNIPVDPDLAIQVGRQLCEVLLEPLQATFGRIAIRSAYRSPDLNAYGNFHGLNCASNTANAAGHIWDLRDQDGLTGATACVVVPEFADRYSAPGEWQRLAWWIHDSLPYSSLEFFPKLWAFNLSWHEHPRRRIDSHAFPKGCLTKPGMANHEGRHDALYDGLPPLGRSPAA